MFRGFFWGIIAGAILGLLFAPKRGEETRAEWQARLEELQNTMQPRVETLRTTLGPTVDNLRTQAQPTVDTLRSKANDIFEQGRQTITSTVNKAQNSSNVSTSTTTASDNT